MKKIFMMEDLECAHCASKMEEAIKKLDGVHSVRVNFLAQKMSLDAADDRFEAILDEAAKICKKFEPDCTILRG